MHTEIRQFQRNQLSHRGKNQFDNAGILIASDAEREKKIILHMVVIQANDESHVFISILF